MKVFTSEEYFGKLQGLKEGELIFIYPKKSDQTPHEIHILTPCMLENMKIDVKAFEELQNEVTRLKKNNTILKKILLKIIN